MSDLENVISAFDNGHHVFNRESVSVLIDALRSPAPAATVTGWRLLEVGEVIQEGDEIFLDEWVKVLIVGDKVNKAIVRRRLTPPAQGDEMRAVNEKLARLESFLHTRNLHPDYEYETTDGPRKNFDADPPSGEGWERNVHRGRDGWERFDYHEEAYWMRLRSAVAALRGAGGEGE